MSQQSNISRSPILSTLKVFGIALLAAILVLAILVYYLGRNLPDSDIPSFEMPAAGLVFAFGSGHPEQDIMQIDSFADGYALLSSGPVKVLAEQLQTLQYIWEPSGPPGELAFFWRQQGNANEVKRAELSTTGSALLDLAAEPDWTGEIVEVGFLVAGDTTNPVAIGQLVLRANDLNTRLRLVWQDWTTYELRSQQSINFLQGGAHNQQVSLPLLVIFWLLVTLLLLRLLSGKLNIELAGSALLPLAITLFMVGWVLLDIRWTVNSSRNANELLSSATGLDADEGSGNDLDGEIYKYIQRLKTDVFQVDGSGKTKRFLIVGDENAIDYYLLRAKYHLLPASAHVDGRFDERLSPDSLDYVLYFGQPGAVANIPGWSATWRNALTEVDRSEWGMVYRVQP